MLCFVWLLVAKHFVVYIGIDITGIVYNIIIIELCMSCEKWVKPQHESFKCMHIGACMKPQFSSHF